MRPHHRLCWAILSGYHESRVRRKGRRLLQHRFIEMPLHVQVGRAKEAEPSAIRTRNANTPNQIRRVRTYSQCPLFSLKFSIHTPIEWRDEMERVGGHKQYLTMVAALTVHQSQSRRTHLPSAMPCPRGSRRGIPAVSCLPTVSDRRRRGHIMVCSSFRLAGLTG